MILKLFPCIIKHRGSISYMKYILSHTRHKGTNHNNPFRKVLAASSPAHSHSENSFHLTNGKETKLKSNIFSTAPEPKDSSLNCNKLLAENQSDIYANLKPVLQPDVTANITESKFEDNNEEVEIKLLNTIDPSSLEWRKQVIDIKHLPKYYKSLSKFRLTALVVLTTAAGYGMAPGVFDAVTLAHLILGTGLTSAAANAINQILEVPYDSQMARTKNRVLICGSITPLHASAFAACSALAGLCILYSGTSGMTACLGLTNLMLYTCLYTPMKRVSIANTWVGSVVGAIPPLMGWAAATGGCLSAGAVLMAGILYSWQFPHFNALSWNLRSDYSRAGYRMTSVVDPALCCRVALRHSVALVALCSAAPLLDLTTWTFAIDSLPLNCFLVYYSWLFYKHGDSSSSRKLFRLSLVYLPIIMALMLIGKKHNTESQKTSSADRKFN